MPIAQKFREPHTRAALTACPGLYKDWFTFVVLHDEENYDLYCSPNIIRVIKSRRMRGAGHVVRVGERRSAYRVSVGRSEGKSTLGRYRRRW